MALIGSEADNASVQVVGVPLHWSILACIVDCGTRGSLYPQRPLVPRHHMNQAVCLVHEILVPGDAAMIHDGHGVISDSRQGCRYELVDPPHEGGVSVCPD
eukprot:6476948-Amphidinium_carterae.2